MRHSRSIRSRIARHRRHQHPAYQRHEIREATEAGLACSAGLPKKSTAGAPTATRDPATPTTADSDHIRTISGMTASLERCARYERSDVGTIIARDVPAELHANTLWHIKNSKDLVERRYNYGAATNAASRGSGIRFEQLVGWPYPVLTVDILRIVQMGNLGRVWAD